MFSYRERSAKSFGIKIQRLSLWKVSTCRENPWITTSKPAAALKFQVNFDKYMKNLNFFFHYNSPETFVSWNFYAISTFDAYYLQKYPSF